MIDFVQELKKFKPSLEVDQAEDAIYKNDLKDITDIMQELMKSKQTGPNNQEQQ